MDTDTLVIGAGPVGMTMAAELARFGVPVRIVEKATARTDKSKALVVWSRTMELLDRAGCGDAFVATGNKVIAANIVAGSRQLAHIVFDNVASPHPYGLMIPQSETERLLEAHLAGLGIKIEREAEAVGFSTEGEGTATTLRHADGRHETVASRWLIGCDGAHSAVRHWLGKGFEGDTLPTTFILADVHLSGIRSPDNELSLYWHSDGVLVFFPIKADRYRVIADVGTSKDSAHRPDPTLAEIQSLVDQRGPGGIVVADPIWLAAFSVNERKVKDYRAGSVFLAGDAAHIHSPAGGQGMNTGMQDAFNLAWKLALVHRGAALPDALLDSYSIERSPIAEEVLQASGRLTAVAVARNPVLQVARNTMARLAFGLAPIRHGVADNLAEVTVGYAHSPLNGPGGHIHHAPAPGERVAPRPGEPPVGGGTDPRFVLFTDDGPGAAQVTSRYPALLDPTVRPALAEGGTWLVRPDGYAAVAARHDEWASITDYLDKLAATD